MLKINPLFSLIVCTALVSGCSISASSKSSADSSGSLSKSASSPSNSSGGSKDQQSQYSKDVSAYTAEFAVSKNANFDDYRLRISKLAEKHGITAWQDDKTTYLAIGQGLRKAGVNSDQLEIFNTSLGGSEAWKLKTIQEGYK
jgi:hypothetical protein